MNNNEENRSHGKLAKLLLVNYGMRRSSYLVRGMVGAYLVYLMYQLFSESDKSGSQLTIAMTLAGVFMMAAGIYFVIGAGYALLNGIFAENDPAELEELENDPETEDEVEEELSEEELEAGEESSVSEMALVDETVGEADHAETDEDDEEAVAEASEEEEADAESE